MIGKLELLNERNLNECNKFKKNKEFLNEILKYNYLYVKCKLLKVNQNDIVDLVWKNVLSHLSKEFN